MNYTIPSPTSPARGRGLLAARAVRPGDIIAVFDGAGTPAIAIPDSNHLAHTCSYCLATPADNNDTTTTTPPVKLRACTGCRVVAYCSPACQKRDWQLVHKLECKVFQRVRASTSASGHVALPTPVRALVQILLLRSDADRNALVGKLESHVDDFRRLPPGNVNDSNRSSAEAVSWQDMELQAMAALHYLGRAVGEREKNEALEVLCKLQVNSFNRLDADIGQTGLFLHPQLAMVNHSCLPSAYVQFSGRVAVLRAYQAINEGDEVEISYIDQALPLSQRQASLKARYHFTCACPRCAEDLDVYQACQRYPHLQLNDLSLATDLSELIRQQTSPPLSKTKDFSKAIAQVQASFTSLPTPPRSSSGATTTADAGSTEDLRRRWSLCQPLLLADTTHSTPFAIHPVPEILTDAVIHFSSRANYAAGLALSSLLATQVEPVRNPFPESPGRVKGLLTLAKLLANAAAPAAAAAAAEEEWSSSPSASASPRQKPQSKALQAAEKAILAVLRTMDVPTTCEVLLLLVLRSASSSTASPSPRPATSSDAQHQNNNNHHHHRMLIQPYHHEAQDILQDIRALPGRHAEQDLVRKLLDQRGRPGPGLGSSSSRTQEEKLFLEMVIVKPLREIAGLARSVMDAEFGGAAVQ
ncbi:uncharacterized protein B0I36DRAFT_381975 [Microdochium trichocladiopsis]|uniref:MYND-type zinc finger protein samB n=1 Tax=Microdochium trichocladiopsis TaxID=1682393 RepID=A0A9P8YDU6_9PEZI|nr:uncharacterized protein B0I36DRAFT_381975 [Microdochium trichocladiopsis]KAH7035223.1 hypothetical protein B0I36DRAFT_381975 [Microdochium trichocladiopsis]